MMGTEALRELRTTTLLPETRLTVCRGSILAFRGDAIVNAANEGCVTGFGVDEAVNRAAGGFLIKEARRGLQGCPTGQAKVTGSVEHTLVNTSFTPWGRCTAISLALRTVPPRPTRGLRRAMPCW
jgi:hypothetical protein